MPGVQGLGSGLSGGAADVPNVPGLGATGSATAADGVATGGAAGTQVAAADGSAAAGAEGSAAPGMAGFPMTGVGAGQSEKDRQRQAWMYEDEDIWGLPTDCIPPVIEGG